MAEIKENSAFHGALELEETVVVPVEEKSPDEGLETAPEENSQGIELIQPETSEDMDKRLEMGDKQVACPLTDDASTSESKDWKPGSRCRAVYSDDGLVYPAVVLWVKGQRCCVRYDHYNNEEEHDISGLLNPDELHGPGRGVPFKDGNWKPGATSNNFDWKRRRRENNQGERGGGGERRWTDDQRNSSAVREKSGSRRQAEKEADERKTGNQHGDEAEKPASHSFPLFPPFPPQMGSESVPPPPFPPPPPPVWGLCGKDAGGSPDVGSITNMLMQWYMCGYHTGTYMAQQFFKSTLKDEVKNPR